MNVDVLSDVLNTVRLVGALHYDFELTAPWVAEAPPIRDIATLVMPGVQRVFEYHLVASGSCWAHAVGQPPVRVLEGDFIVFGQGHAHVLSSTPGLRKAPDAGFYARGPSELPVYFQSGGDGDERVRIICGFLGCDERPYNPLLATLPAMIHVSSKGAAATGPNWFGTLAAMAAQEARAPRAGGQNGLARLSELMFVEALRHYLLTLGPGDGGWLAGLRDPLVGRALQAIHEAPHEPWTVERLARHVGASRSVLAERFTATVGQPPMQYVTLWRMQIASRLLVDGAHVASVAEAIGYESEAAFSRAFKKQVGQSPAAWRDCQVAARTLGRTSGRYPRDCGNQLGAAATAGATAS